MLSHSVLGLLVRQTEITRSYHRKTQEQHVRTASTVSLNYPLVQGWNATIRRVGRGVRQSDITMQTGGRELTRNTSGNAKNEAES